MKDLNQHQESLILNVVNNLTKRQLDLIKDADNPTAEYGIGEIVAARIINTRKNLPNQKYTSIEQLLEVKGVGEDKLEDLLHAAHRGFQYNEHRWQAPTHIYPPGVKVDPYAVPGIGARLMIEQALQRLHGVNLNLIEELGVSPRDLVHYRKEIGSALYQMIREDCHSDLRLRSGAIAYLSALGYQEAIDLFANIALNPSEESSVRGHAVEALTRFGGPVASSTLKSLLDDPLPVLREKVIRGLGKLGDKGIVASLKQVQESDTNEEIRFRAAEAIRLLLNQQQLSRPKPSSPQRTIKMRGITKPIGRHTLGRPQSTPSSGGEGGEKGGIDLVTTQILQHSEQAKRSFRIPLSYKILPTSRGGHKRLELNGLNIGDQLKCSTRYNVYRVHEHQAIIEFVEHTQLIPGRKIDLGLACAEALYQDIYWLPLATNTPTLFQVKGATGPIWAKEEFAFLLSYHLPDNTEQAYLRIRTKFPKANWQELYFPLTSEEIQSGEKIIDGFLAEIPGQIDIQVGLYTNAGSASKYHSQLVVLPTNPIWMSVTPSTTGTIGEGPAHYNASENRFYCYARLRVTNGYAHTVSLGPTVTARVTDGGNEKDTFSFSIGSSTIPPNSVRTIGIWMSFGGDTYDVFRNYGDVTINLSLQTSEGTIRDAHVWAAMGQVKLALNFVGNFSSTTRSRLQRVAENEASAIFERQNLYISDTGIFVIPSNHSDYQRYRDLEMEDNKDSDCTSGSDEADDMRDDWSSPNDTWLDIWLVESLSGPPCSAGVGGFSPVNGPTGKGGKNSGLIVNMSSADLSTQNGRDLMGIIIAHEVGHFLGLNHDSTSSNFMAASTDGTNMNITHSQYLRMADHGFVTRFLPPAGS